MNERPTSENADGLFEPFSIEQVPWEEYSHGERFGVSFRSIGDYGGGTRVGVSMEVLPPGKQAYPMHLHMLEEEHLIIMEGKATLRLGERSFAMEAGSCACFHAGQEAAHALINNGDEPCRYLIIGERDPHDVVVFTDSGRVSVRLMGESYRRSATMQYWDGEDEAGTA
jgi:uncharacterized cupin superfamily protein